MRQCQFGCDRKDCDEASPPRENFTEARKAAVADGWVIHPAGDGQRHIGPACVSALMAQLESTD